MAQTITAWAQITYKRSGKKSPPIQVKIQVLPSGECEAEFAPKLKAVAKQYTTWNGQLSTRLRTPKYDSDNVFYIGQLDTIFAGLSKAITLRFGDIISEVTIDYQKGTYNGTPTATQK